jgi:undecaprenyl-diphosphatase
MFYRIKITFIIILCSTRVFSQGVDLRLLESFNGPVNPGPDRAWRFISDKAIIVEAGLPLGMVVTGLISHDRNLEIKGLEDAGAIIIAEGGTVILKNVFKRERPYLAHPGLITGKSPSTDYSFPSGHASIAFATATSISISYPKWYVIAPSYAFAGLVSYSRLYLGVHYPSDILGGAILGSASAWFTSRAQKWLDGKPRSTGIR